MIISKNNLEKTRQFGKYLQNDNIFIKLSKNFCTKWKIDATSAVIYQVIQNADLLELGCFTGSRNDLAVITYSSIATITRILNILCKRGFIAKVKIELYGKKYVAYKNLGLDCNLPIHIGKPFTPEEKLQMNLFEKSKIIEKWSKEFNIKVFNAV